MVVFWYGLAPFAGALFRRYKWRQFRRHFDKLRLQPVLDYNRYRKQEKKEPDTGEPAVFRFAGGFESVTDGQTMWIRGDNLTLPVSLENAETYLLPMQKDEDSADTLSEDEEAPERIRWDRVSALTEGAKVFVGGLLAYRDGRWSFVSTKEQPLMVIFYDGPDQSLATLVVHAGRRSSDYRNPVTLYSMILGALCQILVAALFISRPAFRMTVIVSFIALFIPLYPIIPPGLLFTLLYRYLFRKSRILRINIDMIRGEEYHSRPEDPFAAYVVLPDRVQSLTRQYTVMALMLEALSWLVLLAGIGLNILFICMVLALL